MGALTLRGEKRPEKRSEKRQDAAALPSLLEFHSPSAALSVTPVMFAARGTTLVTCSLVAACFAAAGLIPIDKVVTAQGKIVAENPTSVIQPLETAIVRSIDVREGQTVKKGDLLAKLDPTFATADAGALQAQVESYQAEVDRLTAEAQNKPFSPRTASPMAMTQELIYAQRMAELTYKLQGYQQKIDSLQSQIQKAMSDINVYRDRLALAKELESKRSELEKLGVGSVINRMAATDSRLEVERTLAASTAQAAQGASDLQAMVAERDGYDQNWHGQVNQDLTDASRKLSDAKENLNKATLRKKLVEIRADQDEVVLSIAKGGAPGAVMQSGETLMSLTPIDAPLEVEMNVAGTDAGFVHPGNPVTIKFDAFPYTQYGGAEGTVRIVSPDSFQGDPDQKQRGTNPAPGQSGPAFFRSRVSIDETTLHDTPPGFHVQPGMPVTTDIKVGKRTMLSYLFARVLPVATDGMREP
jgi:HlyD family secretion protein